MEEVNADANVRFSQISECACDLFLDTALLQARISSISQVELQVVAEHFNNLPKDHRAKVCNTLDKNKKALKELRKSLNSENNLVYVNKKVNGAKGAQMGEKGKTFDKTSHKAAVSL